MKNPQLHRAGRNEEEETKETGRQIAELPKEGLNDFVLLLLAPAISVARLLLFLEVPENLRTPAFVAPAQNFKVIWRAGR